MKLPVYAFVLILCFLYTKQVSFVQTAAVITAKDDSYKPGVIIEIDTTAQAITTKNEQDENATGSTGQQATTKKPSVVSEFFKRLQCSLKKASSFAEDIEKEAKRLEASAKRFSVTVFGKLGDIVETIIGNHNQALASINTAATTTAASNLENLESVASVELADLNAAVVTKSHDSTTTTSAAAAVVTPTTEAPLDNEISNSVDDDEKCPTGFETNADGICERRNDFARAKQLH